MSNPVISVLLAFFRCVRHSYHCWLCARDLFPVLKLCRFSFITVVIGAIALIFVDQGQEALRALVDVNSVAAGIVPWGFFLSCVCAWAFYSAYCARVILYIDFPEPMKVGECTARFRREVPRLLGVLAIGAVAIALAVASFGAPSTEHALRLRILASICVILAIVFYGLAIIRMDAVRNVVKLSRRYTARFTLAQPAPDSPPSTDRHAVIAKDFLQLPRETLLAFTTFFAVSAGCFVVFAFAPISAGQYLGAVTILLSALAAWIPIGTTLVYLTERYRWPPLMSALILWAVVISYWTDNHEVRVVAPLDLARPALATQASNWLDKRKDIIKGATRKYPVFIVTAEGGGIRAAYWTASVLTALEDRLQGIKDGTHFSDHVFAISGVSGGSLGGSVFAALLAERNRRGMVGCDRNDGKQSGKLMQNCANNVLREDFLAPTLATMLYPDLVYRFLPIIPKQYSDRATTLETAWESAWRKAHTGSNIMGETFDSLWQDDKDLKMPSLFLNGTAVETGKRMIMSNVQIVAEEFSDAYDIQKIIGSTVPLSTAAHMSARFTYVSPAGTLINPPHTRWGHVVDGGYFENSGATTALEAMLVVEQAAEKMGIGGRIVPVVIMISNNPDRKPPASSTADPGFSARRWMNEVLSPLIAILETREARGTFAEETIKSVLDDDSKQFLRFGLQPRGVPLPLGWMLSDAAEDEIDSQLTGILGDAAKDAPMTKLREFLGR